MEGVKRERLWGLDLQHRLRFQSSEPVGEASIGLATTREPSPFRRAASVILPATLLGSLVGLFAQADRLKDFKGCGSGSRRIPKGSTEPLSILLASQESIFEELENSWTLTIVEFE